MGQIANQMALELFFKIKRRLKEKREEKKLYMGGEVDSELIDSFEDEGLRRGDPAHEDEK